MRIANLVRGLFRSSSVLRVPGGTRRKLAGRGRGVALATAGVLALGLTSAVVASPANAAGGFLMRNDRWPTQCITSDGRRDTTAATFSCNGNANQTWHTGGHIPGHYGTYYQLINNATGQCLGISGGSTAAGAHAVVWACNGHHDQYWTWIVPGLPNVGVFINQNSSLVLQTACNCGQNWAVVNQAWYNGGLSNQAWIF